MLSHAQYVIMIALYGGFAAMEYVLDRAQHFGATRADNTLDFVGLVLLAIVTQPGIIWLTGAIGHSIAPQYANALIELPWYAKVALLLLFDDMMQYWWHRASHQPMLWPLHRAHHSAHYMSARMIYRNNFFYYVFMPAIWLSGVLVYLGLGTVYLVYLAVKLAVITGAHSDIRWDAPLYRIKALAPVMWVVQRVISTPATHFAHHAATNRDGIGHYTGNYGNLLFFWDVLFGTSHITQQYPARVGLNDDMLFGPENWWVELFYPLFWSKRVHSALTPGGAPYGEQSENDGLGATAAE
jgi:sterol desaturase/sphingolipid hydroxylase (fatty acid hydroxylase superfamily)